jgi:predicted Fe-Mo cluster-binding NifX family protein
VKVAVCAEGQDWSAQTSLIFGRCPYYLFVDTETMESEPVSNPLTVLRRGVGMRAAQFVADHGAQAVIAGHVGPNACGILRAAGVQVYLITGGTVRQALDALKAHKLQPIERPEAGWR